MKTTVFTLALTAILTSSFFIITPAILMASPQQQTVSDTISMGEIIKKLEKRFGVSITIDAEAAKVKVISSSKEILKSSDIGNALNQLVKGTGLTYRMLRTDYYVISNPAEPQKTPAADADKPGSNKKIVSGKVTSSEDGESLPGVNVFIKGTTTGVTTNANGDYQIKVEGTDKILVFSFMGMQRVEVPIKNKTAIDVGMISDAFGLDEVVVAGMAAATPKKNVTVSVTKVNDQTLKSGNAPSTVQALSGKVAGLSVVQANGQPGTGAAMRIRGSTSLEGRQAPMVMLDGNILQTNLADINVGDIESVEVVKGAAAASMYGSQGGNGVIVITTKRGSLGTGKPATFVDFKTRVGVQEIPNFIEQATHHPYDLAEDWQDFPTFTKYAGVDYDSLGNPILGNRHVSEDAYADKPYAYTKNQQAEVYGKGMYYSVYASVYGNGNKTNYLISYERNQQDGIVFNTGGYTRNNLRVNLDLHASPSFKLSTSNLLILTDSKKPGSNDAFNDLLFVAPDVNLNDTNVNGTPYKILPDPWSVAENPLYPLYYRERSETRYSLIGNIMASWQITPWISLDGKYAYEIRNKYWNTYTPKGYLANGGQTIGGSLYKSSFYQFDQNFQFTANLNKQFNDFTTKLKLSYLYEGMANNSYWVLGRDFIASGIPQLDNMDQTKTTDGSGQQEIVSINYFAILDADWKDKIMLSALFRMDGSSLFGDNEKWNPYYRFSLGYRLTEDVTIPGIQELKIRASIGTSGQRPGFSWQYETFTLVDGAYVPTTIGNENLKPSETTEIEAGIDINFLHRLSFEFVYSSSETKNAFALAPTPSHMGAPSQWQNIGTLENTVFEASLDMNLFTTTDFNWNAGLVFDKIKQEVTQLGIPPYTQGPRHAFYVQPGEVFGTMYGYKWLTSLEEMANQLPEGKTIDDYEINSDGYVIPAGTQGTIDEKAIKYDGNGDDLPDKVEIGNGNPNFRLSFTNNFTFKGFTLHFLFSWKNGGDVYNYTRQYTFRDQRAIEYDMYGVPENEKKTIYYYDNFYDGTAINSYFVEDGSYLKFRELSLFYTIAGEKLKKAHLGFIRTLTVGFEGTNLITWTNYKGYDPEVASGTDLTNYPFDDFSYPNYRVYTASLSLTF